jgi:hypothetical protein
MALGEAVEANGGEVAGGKGCVYRVDEFYLRACLALRNILVNFADNETIPRVPDFTAPLKSFYSLACYS